MNIDPTIEKPNADLSAVKTQQKRVGDGNAAAQNADSKPTAASVSDSVRLSPQYQALAKSVSNSSSFNEAKVLAIKKDIAEGKFTVDPGKIADGVLAAAKDLIQSQSKQQTA